MPDIEDFLTQSEPAAPAPEPEPAPEPVAVETAPVAEGVTGEPPAPELPPRGDDGRWVKREAAPPPATQGHMVPLEALLAEREKRQAAEAAAKAQAPKPDFWENPEAAVKAQLESEREQLRREVAEEANAQARKLFLEFTENEARGRYGDYDQARSAFAEEAARNPTLVSQLREAPNPAEFIYRQGKTVAELREVGGNLEAYKKRIEAEVRQKFEAELAAKAARTASVPQSLNSEPSKGAGISGAVWNGPTPIEDILPNRRQ